MPDASSDILKNHARRYSAKLCGPAIGQGLAVPKVTVAPGVRRAFQEEVAVIMGGVQQQGGALPGVGPGSEHEVKEKSRPVAGPVPGPSMLSTSWPQLTTEKKSRPNRRPALLADEKEEVLHEPIHQK